MGDVLSLWFGPQTPVNRKAYAASGIGLMAVRYVLDNLLILLAGGAWVHPLHYLSPALKIRFDIVHLQQDQTGSWLFFALGLSAIPFIWIGVSMSIRRARDAGWPGWVGLLFFAPFLNFLMITCLAFAASVEPSHEKPTPTKIDGPLLVPVLSAALATLGVAVLLTLLSVHVLGEYGSALFIGTPFVMGVIAARVVNAQGYRGLRTSMVASTICVIVAGGALVLFALEGIICLTMAAPLAFGLTLLGAIVGDSMSRGPLTETSSTRSLVIALPLLAALPALTPSQPPVHPVTTSLEINAPPEVVWENVIRFEPLPEPEHWLFKAGIAAPLRARIEGEGVGAVRHCEFTTGAFVEPITVWDPPRHLAFDVTSHPPSMREMGIWPVVHAPHIESAMASQRGEFRLTPLPGGRTLLEGTTWYRLDMAPQVYWTLYSDAVVHQIHHRVLSHIANLSEREDSPR
jgi:uncharacterized membrane protein YhaH (DUF805 family)